LINSPSVCGYCNKRGHSQDVCYKQQRDLKTNNNQDGGRGQGGRGSRFEGTCFTCNQQGHRAAQCSQRAEQEEEEEEEEGAAPVVALAAFPPPTPDQLQMFQFWQHQQQRMMAPAPYLPGGGYFPHPYQFMLVQLGDHVPVALSRPVLDSGAPVHIVPKREMLEDFTPTSPLPLVGLDGVFTGLTSVGTGTWMLPTCGSTGRVQHLRLPNTHLVVGSKVAVVSETALMHLDWCLKKDQRLFHGAVLTHPDGSILHVPLQGHHFVFTAAPASTDPVHFMKSEAPMTTETKKEHCQLVVEQLTVLQILLHLLCWYAISIKTWSLPPRLFAPFSAERHHDAVDTLAGPGPAVPVLLTSVAAPHAYIDFDRGPTGSRQSSLDLQTKTAMLCALLHWCALSSPPWLHDRCLIFLAGGPVSSCYIRQPEAAGFLQEAVVAEDNASVTNSTATLLVPSTDQQTADTLTKSLPKDVFDRHRAVCTG
jgi:hypothetical protein